MRKIKISAALERRIRAGERVNEELVALLDEAHEPKSTGGLSYKELVALFRGHLGEQLALPPNPATGWIVRQVQRAKELGLDAESISQVVKGAHLLYPRGPYELEYLLRAAPRLIATAARVGAGVPKSAGPVVKTGRLDD